MSRKSGINSEENMVKRFLKLTTDYSVLLLGARGAGKSTLVREIYPASNNLYIDLLNPEEEARFARNPNLLIELVEAMPFAAQYVIVDGVQKQPKLLDVVHLLLESRKCGKYFILTGSSARKLKAAGVNLLAGRAFVYHLFPFSYLECGESFRLEDALRYGMLPKIFEFTSSEDKQRFLQSYTLTYLKEEIWAEQLIRNLHPFRRFLEVAAQSNGKIINYSTIARDVGADDKTVKNYFSLLEDTLLGFMLAPYHHSFRKRLKSAPKFYFFDVGVTRALAQLLTVTTKEGTSYYGELFESFVIIECIKLASYYYSEYRFSYFMTGAGLEIDLVVERPAQLLLLIEIKSSEQVRSEDLKSLRKISVELGNCEAVCFSNDPLQRKVDGVMVYPWKEGIEKFFALQ
jgi:predicted AAA+ superfamily ATPase